MGSLITKENLAKLAPTDAMTFIVAIASLLIAGTPRYPCDGRCPADPGRTDHPDGGAVGAVSRHSRQTAWPHEAAARGSLRLDRAPIEGFLS